MLYVAVHLGWFAEQDIHRHVDRFVVVLPVDQLQLPRLGGGADRGKQAALALAQVLEQRQAVRRNRQHITLLRFVTPDFFRRHATLFQRDLAQVENRSAFGVVGNFREGIRQAAGADVVNRQDRIGVAHGPTGIDHFLRAPLHLRVAALHRIKIEVGGVGPGRHR